MKLSTNWLGKYIGRTISPRQIADALELAGIEVEQIMSPILYDKKIIAVLIKKVVQHPNADKLKLVVVDTGTDELQIVCGAPNVVVGQIAVLAQLGALLPDGTLIAEAKLRGEVSKGMLCSARELGLSDEHAGIYILDAENKPGTALCDIDKSSTILDISTPANRFDVLSLIGLAREIAARSKTQLLMPQVKVVDFGGDGPSVQLMVGHTHLRRYSLTRLGIDAKATGNSETAAYLLASGIRPIHPAVDSTNFVLLETGQPLHAFDAAKVMLPIVVRMATAEEKLITLDGVERTLCTRDLVIADQTGAIALAGVMGGKRTAVGVDTTEILLEAAIFTAGGVRKSALRQGLRTEASSRYERSLPDALLEFGLGRALQILEDDVSAVQKGATTIVVPAEVEASALLQINIHPQRICKLIGIDLSVEVIQAHLQSLELASKMESDGSLSVDIPWWRTDLQLGEDLVEEVVRLIGYDMIVPTLPSWQPTDLKLDNQQADLWKLKSSLKACGLFEVLSYSFVSADQLLSFGYRPKDHIKLANPMSIEQAYLRSNLMPSLLSVVSRNDGYAKNFGIYEISKVFRKTQDGELPQESLTLGVMIRESEYEKIKHVLDILQAEFNTRLEISSKDFTELHPGRSAELLHGGRPIGRIGEIHPEIIEASKISGPVLYLGLEVAAFLQSARKKHAKELSKYPAIRRDLAVVVQETVSWADMERVASELKLADVSFLNEFHGKDIEPGHKSVAMRLEMTSLVTTLTEKEAEERLGAIMKQLHTVFGAQLRS